MNNLYIVSLMFYLSYFVSDFQSWPKVPLVQNTELVWVHVEPVWPGHVCDIYNFCDSQICSVWQEFCVCENILQSYLVYVLPEVYADILCWEEYRTKSYYDQKHGKFTLAVYFLRGWYTVISLLLRIKVEQVFAKQSHCIQTEMYTFYRKWS